jgi:hypothetical protein
VEKLRAAQIGMDPALLHRVAVIGSGTLDSLPHNGAVVTLLSVCGCTHGSSYKDVFAETTWLTCRRVASSDAPATRRRLRWVHGAPARYDGQRCRGDGGEDESFRQERQKRRLKQPPYMR